ncbi:MAG: hypothetical protein IKR23_02895 [Lachnospiraceae bacterium]|nr:hypothetical protein [Lachnospiraceae bacterium]
MKYRRSYRLLTIALSLVMQVNASLPSFAEEPEEPDYGSGISYEADDEDEEEYSGYFEIPGKGEVSLVDNDISLIKIDNDLVDDPDVDIAEAEILSLGEPSEEPVELASAFPFAYTQSDEIRAYFTEKYPVNRNQNPYGSCWAHSAMALTEFYMINHGLVDTGVDTDLSELHMAYYCYYQGTPSIAGDTGDKVSFDGTGGILNAGGNLDFASQTLINGRGAVSENEAPYTFADNMNNGSYAPLGIEYDSVARLRNAREINIENRSLIKQCISENGIVGVSIYAMDSCYNDEHNCYYGATHVNTNHAITLVGWDDSFPKEYFNASGSSVPQEDGAWLVRNSWNNGSDCLSYYNYFWLSYEDSSLTQPNGSTQKSAWTFDIALPEELPANNYFYTSQIHSKSYILKPYCANIYTACSGAAFEDIKAVSFDALGLEGDGTDYEISIYTHVNPSKGPASGRKVKKATTTGTLYLDGKYTIDLNESVTVRKGESFAVVIRRSDDKTICYERAYSRSNGIKYTVGCKKGQSFYSADGLTWTDVVGSSSTNTRSNFVINALTSDHEGDDPILNDTLSAFDPAPDMNSDVLYLVKGQKFDLDPSEGWTSGDKKIANINKSGQLTAKKAGKTIISGNGKEYDVYVSKPGFLKKNVTLVSGERFDIEGNITVAVDGVDIKDAYPIYYYSLQPSVVKVVGTQAYGLSAGSATVCAVIGAKTFKFNIKVTENRKDVKISKADDTIVLSPLQSFKAELKGYSFKDAVWSSDMGMSECKSAGGFADPVVHISSKGKITAIGTGTTHLTCNNGVKLQISVPEPVTRDIYLNTGAKKKIKINGVKNQDADWSYDDKSGVVSVSNKGSVNALSAGSVSMNIHYASVDAEGAGFDFKVNVFVEDPAIKEAGGLKQNSAYAYTLTINAGEYFDIEYLDGSGHAMYQQPVYKSTKPLCAFADEYGTIFANKAGDTTISTKINGKVLKIKVKVTGTQ